MKRIFFISVFAFLCSAMAFAAPSSVTGKWSVHRNISGNEGDSSCSFTQTDKTFTGSCKSEDRETDVKGTVDGNKVSWTFNTDYQGTPLTVTYTGTLDDSGKITGTVDIQPYNVSGDFTATSVK